VKGAINVGGLETLGLLEKICGEVTEWAAKLHTYSPDALEYYTKLERG